MKGLGMEKSVPHQLFLGDNYTYDLWSLVGGDGILGIQKLILGIKNPISSTFAWYLLFQKDIFHRIQC